MCAILQRFLLRIVVHAPSVRAWNRLLQPAYVRPTCPALPQVPLFLSSSVAEKVLMTGKYLTVVRECGRDVQCPFAATASLVYDPTNRTCAKDWDASPRQV